MTILSIDIENDVFSCIQKEEFAVLTLKENALKIFTSVGVKEELFSALSAVEESASVKGLIVINSLQYPGDVEYMRLLEGLIGSESYKRNKHTIEKLKNMHSQMMRIFINFEKPIVAGMNGNIEPFFMGVCFAAEYRFATPGTKLVRINTKMGLPPDGVVAFFLMQNLGQAKTIDIFLSKSSVSATEAYDLGLLTEVVSENKLQKKCFEKLEKICELPSHAISATRRLIQPQLSILDDFIEKSYDDYLTNLMIMQGAGKK
jgi:enoyl-CoA hydratase/carnithine racemase